MRVIAYKGDADGDPSGEVTATPQETAPPAPSTATVDGATMTITFDEPLDAGGTPNKSSFAVTVAASSRGVDAVSVSGSVVTLTLVTGGGGWRGGDGGLHRPDGRDRRPAAGPGGQHRGLLQRA